MKYFVTADMHFGHAAIIEAAHRPFANVDHMNAELVRRYNQVIGQDDTCFILGDFCLRKSGDPKAEDWLAMLNGQKIMIRGNHDNGNSVKTIMSMAYLRYGGKRIAIIHDPSDGSVEHDGGVRYDPRCYCADLILCGHVHNCWTWKNYDYPPGYRTLAINVGVDAWGFAPVKLDTVVKMADDLVSM